MATFSGKVQDRQIVLQAFVAPVGLGSGNPESVSGMRSYPALLDTGAQVTLISPKAATEVGLASTGYAAIVPATGEPIEVPKYRASIGVGVSVGAAHQLAGADLDIAGLPYQPDNYEILLGMDILKNFHVSLYNDRFVFSI